MRLSRSNGAFVLTLGLLAGAPVAGGLRAQATLPKAPFDRLYHAYAAGDRDVVVRSLRTGDDVRVLHAPIDEKRLRSWLGPWDRTKAAFLLELADAEAELSAHHMTALTVGRAYVMSRPAPLGQNADEDQFEAAWHRMALGVLQGGIYPESVLTYADALEQRYAAGLDTKIARLDPRVALERGIAQEQRCALSSRRADCLREAARQFAVAARVPETADEARVRGAWVQFQLRDLNLALETIDAACPPDSDPDVRYLKHLFEGRILDALGRFDDAERHYRLALEIRPFAQSAGVALSMTLFKLSRPDEAVKAARAVRLQTGDLVSDPWWTYLRGDARFVPQWRADVRARITP